GPEERRTKALYVPPDHPTVTLIRTRKGAIPTWWWMICPRCRGRREALHRPLWALPGDWRCMRCHKLTWASRRHGRSERSFSRAMHRRNPGHRTCQRIARERSMAMRLAARNRASTRSGSHRRTKAEGDRRALTAMVLDILTHFTDAPIVIESDRLRGPRVVP